MSSTFLVLHRYQPADRPAQVKRIGNFSSRERAEETIRQLRQVAGFKDWPENFQIHEIAVDVLLDPEHAIHYQGA